MLERQPRKSLDQRFSQDVKQTFATRTLHLFGWTVPVFRTLSRFNNWSESGSVVCSMHRYQWIARSLHRLIARYLPRSFTRSIPRSLTRLCARPIPPSPPNSIARLIARLIDRLTAPSDGGVAMLKHCTRYCSDHCHSHCVRRSTTRLRARRLSSYRSAKRSSSMPA